MIKIEKVYQFPFNLVSGTCCSKFKESLLWLSYQWFITIVKISQKRIKYPGVQCGNEKGQRL